MLLFCFFKVIRVNRRNEVYQLKCLKEFLGTVRAAPDIVRENRDRTRGIRIELDRDRT